MSRMTAEEIAAAIAALSDLPAGAGVRVVFVPEQGMKARSLVGPIRAILPGPVLTYGSNLTLAACDAVHMVEALTEAETRVYEILVTQRPETIVIILDQEGWPAIDGLAGPEFSRVAGEVDDGLLLRWIAQAGATACLRLQWPGGEDYMLFHSHPAHAADLLRGAPFAVGTSATLTDLNTGEVKPISLPAPRQLSIVDRSIRWAASRARIRAGRPLIYYARAVRSRRTVKEAVELEAIRLRFPRGVILNEIGLAQDFRSAAATLAQLDRADIIIFSTDEEYVGRGVYAEVMRGARENKPVFLVQDGRVVPWSGSFQVLDREWTAGYAVPVLE